MLAFFHDLARIRGFLRPGDSSRTSTRKWLPTSRWRKKTAYAGAHRRGGAPGRPRAIGRHHAAARVVARGVGLPWLDGFALDAKLGLRMLRRSWGLTLAGGLAMTIVITIAAVVFVFLDEFMGRTAPPLDEGERVVALQSWDVEAHRRREMSRRDLERWGATLQSVEDLGGFQTIERRLMVEAARPSGCASPRSPPRASGWRASRRSGRWIAEADEHVAAAPVVVIGYDVWQSRFASDRAVIGQTVRLGEILHTVVGVMPEGFAFPVNHRYWIPLRSDPFGSLKPAPAPYSPGSRPASRWTAPRRS